MVNSWNEILRFSGQSPSEIEIRKSDGLQEVSWCCTKNLRKFKCACEETPQECVKKMTEIRLYKKSYYYRPQRS